MTKRFVLAYEKGNEAIFEDRDYPYPKRMTNKEVETKLNELAEENEQLRQLLAEYRKTNKHLSELCADASKNGYLPPLEDLR